MLWHELAEALGGAWGCWNPALAPDAKRVAYVSDRGGLPQVWVQDVDGPGSAVAVILSDDPVVSVQWSADGAWLACAVASGGGVRTEVWVVRPDGSGARCIAGGDGQHASLGPWSHRGARLAVRLAPSGDEAEGCCYLIDAESGDADVLCFGDLVEPVDLSPDERTVVLRDGTRGGRYCLLLDRTTGTREPALPFPGAGSTESGLLRGSADGSAAALYLVSDTGSARRELVGVPVHAGGHRGQAGSLASRADAELELLAADEAGALLVLVWNVSGRSEVEFFDPRGCRSRPAVELPGSLVSDVVVARDGSRVVVTLHSPSTTRQPWCIEVATGDVRPVTSPAFPELNDLIEPSLLSFAAHDGLQLTGWLYRAAEEHAPVVISLHGGPESQERPGWNPLYQALLAAGVSVFAPNVRGSSGFGRAFEHADDRYGRYDAIADVRRCVDVLLAEGVGEWGRVGVTGWSYGGYLTMAALTFYPHVFAAGVPVCGMFDLLTFYRDTEPWIAAAAVSKYGNPVRDQHLLHDLSPIHHLERLVAPVLVIHGELDTNVPVGESRRLVSALNRLRLPVAYVQVAGEGHVLRRRDARVSVITATVEFLTAQLARGARDQLHVVAD